MRDAAIIELILQTGMKLSEVARLAKDDVELPTRISRDADPGSVFIHAAGGKERRLLLNYKACRALKVWLSARPGIAGSALFVTRFGKPLRERGLQNLVAKYLRAAGIQGASVASLRHTFGVHHAMKGTDLRVIQEQMGLQRLADVEVYSILARKDARSQLQDHAL